jgi:hypothetical protein
MISQLDPETRRDPDGYVCDFPLRQGELISITATVPVKIRNEPVHKLLENRKRAAIAGRP